MFVPTIKYKRVDTVKEATTSITNNLRAETTSIKKVPEIPSTSSKDSPKVIVEEKKEQQQQLSKKKTDDDTLEEKEKNKHVSVKKEIYNEKLTNTITFEEESTQQPTITVDPNDNERILITLSDGTQYTTDRYCPHAGADLSYLGQVEEDEYPPEIGPIVLCTLHYWEYALKRGGRGANGVATINACPVNKKDDIDHLCPTKKELEW